MGVKKKASKTKTAAAARKRKVAKPTTEDLVIRITSASLPLSPDQATTNGDTGQNSSYTRVDVRILTFAENDVAGNNMEVQQVKSTFESFNYSVEEIKMSGDDAWLRVERELTAFFDAANRDTLQIIYYIGHGYVGRWEGGSVPRLSFCSHKCPTTPGFSKMRWNNLCQLIMGSSSDTLTILSCCNAGMGYLAVGPNDDNVPHEYRKVLITASDWNQYSSLDFGMALTQALRSFSDRGYDMSTETLTARTNQRLVRMFTDFHTPPQAHHGLLQRTLRPKIVLRRLDKKGGWRQRLRIIKPRDYVALAGLRTRRRMRTGAQSQDASEDIVDIHKLHLRQP